MVWTDLRQRRRCHCQAGRHCHWSPISAQPSSPPTCLFFFFDLFSFFHTFLFLFTFPSIPSPVERLLCVLFPTMWDPSRVVSYFQLQLQVECAILHFLIWKLHFIFFLKRRLNVFFMGGILLFGEFLFDSRLPAFLIFCFWNSPWFLEAVCQHFLSLEMSLHPCLKYKTVKE